MHAHPQSPPTPESTPQNHGRAHWRATACTSTRTSTRTHTSTDKLMGACMCARARTIRREHLAHDQHVGSATDRVRHYAHRPAWGKQGKRLRVCGPPQALCPKTGKQAEAAKCSVADWRRTSKQAQPKHGSLSLSRWLAGPPPPFPFLPITHCLPDARHLMMQSELLPSACPVELPSKLQSGYSEGSRPSSLSKVLVLECSSLNSMPYARQPRDMPIEEHTGHEEARTASALRGASRCRDGQQAWHSNGGRGGQR